MRPARIGAGLSKKQVNRAGLALRDAPTAPPGRRLTDHLAAAESPEAVAIVESWRAKHAVPLAKINANLRYYIKKTGSDASPTQRLKRFDTIVDKLRRQPTMKLTTMEDIGGVRVVLSNQDEVDAVVAELQRQPRWRIRRTREYLTGRNPGPKADGYRAVHLTVVRDGCFVEIQLRTPWQDAWAQSVEQDTRRLRAGLKFGAGPDDLREYYRVVADFFEAREHHLELDPDFMEDLARLFSQTRVYFPGPDGDTQAP